MNTSLPIFSYKQEIIQAVKNSAVTIITAETGSGKSTQVPQYLREAGYDVVTTEPRRMAAWSLAERVAEEMESPLGEIVGFRTGFERNDSPNTSILYCTDGLELVRTLTDTKNKPKVMIIDEVHEWNLNIETLIAWAKKKISENWLTKVVIMSATLDSESLAMYYGESVHLLQVPGKLFPVSFMQKWEDELIPSILQMIQEGHNTLVFVAGKKEIEEVTKKLSDVQAVVLPLHGELDSLEQKKCFESYSLPKVVVATNVAQTSITIPDIDAVVDTGKERRTEVIDGIQGLFLREISQADCLQRKGRAGRTKEGIYILCSNTSLEEREQFSTPEIQRGILDQIVLRLATCKIDATELEFFHQPSKEALSLAKEALLDLGALEEDGNVTEIGYKMAKIPVSVQSARMIIEAEKYGVTEEVINIASILEIGRILNNDTPYSRFTQENTSDLLAEADVLVALQKMGYINFKELGVNKKNFFRIKEHIQKMHEALTDVVTITSSSWQNRDSIKMACLAGMIGHVYKNNWGNEYVNGDNIRRILDKKSCLSGYFTPKLLVGIPRTIEYKDSWGDMSHLELVTMATKVTVEDLKVVAPQCITQEDGEPYYSSWSDVVKIPRITYFKDIKLGMDEIAVEDHPVYEKLKQEYESNQKSYYIDKRQKYVMIDGKNFEVAYRLQHPFIVVDDETLYHTEVKNVFLDDGTKVQIACNGNLRRDFSMLSLRNAVENTRVKEAWDRAKRHLPELNGCKLSVMLEGKQFLGKKEITRGNGGYGNPIYGFVCLALQKNKTLQLELCEEEEQAEEKTKEAVEFLYGKVICENYSDKKFKFKKGVKGLSPKEERVKREFDSEVRELLVGLDINNIEERLEYLEELYEEMVENLKIT